MRGIYIVALTLLLIVSGHVAPAGAADREQQQILADLRILQAQTQQLQQMLTSVHSLVALEPVPCTVRAA